MASPGYINAACKVKFRFLSLPKEYQRPTGGLHLSRTWQCHKRLAIGSCERLTLLQPPGLPGWSPRPLDAGDENIASFLRLKSLNPNCPPPPIKARGKSKNRLMHAYKKYNSS